MRVAVLDDTEEDSQRILSYLQKYQKEKNKEFKIDIYNSSLDFLDEYNSQFDVIFLDIEMPGIDGLAVAHELREKDRSVGIIFLTNMGKYAIQGYKVNAIDYIVKPVSYFVFSDTFEKAMNFVKIRSEKDILLKNNYGIYRIKSTEILYIEKSKDNLIYHTTQGDFIERGSIKQLKEFFLDLPFSESANGFLVNLEKVQGIGKDDIKVNDIIIPLSRRMKKIFTQDYISYIGGY